MTAADVAAIAYRDLMRGKTTIIPGLKNQILAMSVRLSPRWLTPKITRRLQEPRAI
jgi:hypothetical protein